MNQTEDLYEILQVSPSAEQDVIQAAYRRLARRYHTDVNKSPGAREMMYRLNHAYEILKDPNERAAYDKSRKLDEYPHLDEDPDWLEDTEYPVQVTLEEACFGTSRFLDLPGGRRLAVKIPPGVDNGSRVHITVGRVPKESISLVISVRPYLNVQRQGCDLSCDVDVGAESASLGGEVTVPTMSGRVALTIPPGTQNGRRFRLAGQGMPVLNNPSVRGDLYIAVNVIQPHRPTAEKVEPAARKKEQSEYHVHDLPTWVYLCVLAFVLWVLVSWLVGR